MTFDEKDYEKDDEKDYEKGQKMKKDQSTGPSENSKAAGRDERDFAQEPSGAAEYLKNAGRYHADQTEDAKQDPRIPSGGGHTEEDYLALPDDLRAELIDGVFYAMSSPSRIHQTVALEIARQLWDCVEEHHRDCFVYIAPSDVALGEDKRTVVQPDVYVHCDREKDKKPGPFRGTPDFVVEVLSPADPENDLWRKRDLYRRHGVREYWIVNPRGTEVYVFVFEKPGDGGDMPEKFSFEDKVPVEISGGICEVDFRKVYRKIEHFF